MKQIYIHGLGQNARSWGKVIEKLGNSEDYICPNLPELVEDDEMTYQNLYSAFSDMCDAINDEIILCGISLGGVLALNYAIEYADKVKALVLIAAQYKMPKQLLKFQNLLFRFMPKSMFSQMGFKKNDFLKLCNTMMDLDFANEVNKISCPTLIICGEKDSANKKASAELANILNTKLQEVRGAGHEVNVEAPEELAEMLRHFLI